MSPEVSPAFIHMVGFSGIAFGRYELRADSCANALDGLPFRPSFSKGKTMPRYRAFFIAAWAAYVLLIGALSLMPGKDVPAFSFSDKLAHAGAYALMAMLAPWSQAGFKGAWAAMLTAILYGAALEVGQGLLAEERYPDVWDGLANAVGAAAGALARHHFDNSGVLGRIRQ
jgi:VanZ family protein